MSLKDFAIVCKLGKLVLMQVREPTQLSTKFNAWLIGKFMRLKK